MSKRFAWLLGLVGLVSLGWLVACGGKYSASSNGLVLVASQGSNVIETFSFDLGSGRISEINSPPGTSAPPAAMVIDPAGAYAYVIVGSEGSYGIESFKVNSDGSVTAGSTTPDNSPVALAMDSLGKFLFVAEGLNLDENGVPNGAYCPDGVSKGVCVYSISNGTLTPVTSTFVAPATVQAPNLVAFATTPTAFPSINSSCSTISGTNPPSSEFLYAADSVNNLVWEFSVDTTTGALGNPPGFDSVQTFAVGSVPSGVAVDACARFVYVTNNLSNNVSAFSICNGASTQSAQCTSPDGKLFAVKGSPFSMAASANGPGPLVADPLGNNVYVLSLLSNTVSTFKIAQSTGDLTPGSPETVATGGTPKSIAIRSDNLWLFVSNNSSATLSEFEITPATGSLTPQPVISTDNLPWGIAVK